MIQWNLLNVIHVYKEINYLQRYALFVDCIIIKNVKKLNTFPRMDGFVPNVKQKKLDSFSFIQYI